MKTDHKLGVLVYLVGWMLFTGLLWFGTRQVGFSLAYQLGGSGSYLPGLSCVLAES